MTTTDTARGTATPTRSLFVAGRYARRGRDDGHDTAPAVSDDATPGPAVGGFTREPRAECESSSRSPCGQGSRSRAKVGLHAPAFEAVAARRPLAPGLGPQLLPGLIAGFVGGMVLFAVNRSAPAALGEGTGALHPSAPRALAVRRLHRRAPSALGVHDGADLAGVAAPAASEQVPRGPFIYGLASSSARWCSLQVICRQRQCWSGS